eukprot:363631-Chlamydomonas_euryale.AAC.4
MSIFMQCFGCGAGSLCAERAEAAAAAAAVAAAAAAGGPNGQPPTKDESPTRPPSAADYAAKLRMAESHNAAQLARNAGAPHAAQEVRVSRLLPRAFPPCAAPSDSSFESRRRPKRLASARR